MSQKRKMAAGGCLGSSFGGILGALVGGAGALMIYGPKPTGTPLDFLGIIFIPIILLFGGGLGGLIGLVIGSVVGVSAAAGTHHDRDVEEERPHLPSEPRNNVDEIAQLEARLAELKRKQHESM